MGKQKYTENQIIEAYKELSKKVGRMATIIDIKENDFICSDWSIYNRFGSMANLQIKAGYEPQGIKYWNSQKSIYKTEKEIKDKLAELYKENNSRIFTNDLSKIPGLSFNRLKKVFDINSMDELWEQIEKEYGIEKNKKEKSYMWSKEKIEKAVIIFIEKYNRFPDYSDFKKLRNTETKGLSELPKINSFKKYFPNMTLKEFKEYMLDKYKKEE